MSELDDAFAKFMGGSPQEKEQRRKEWLQQLEDQRKKEYDEWKKAQENKSDQTQYEDAFILDDNEGIDNSAVDQTLYEKAFTPNEIDNINDDKTTISDNEDKTEVLPQEEKQEFIEEQIENNPTKATEILDPKDNTELYEEATQVMDDNPHNDEVNNEAFENENTDDLFAKFAKNANTNDNTRFSDEDKKYLEVGRRLNLLKEWQERIGGEKYYDENGNLAFKSGQLTDIDNYDKVVKDVKKTIESIPKFGSLASDLDDDVLKRASRQARKKTREEFGFTKDDALNELLYRQGKGSILDTKPTPRWNDERFQKFQNKLNKAAESINVNDPDSIKQLSKLQRQRKELAEALKQRKYLAYYNENEINDINIVENLQDDIEETAVDESEALQSIEADNKKEYSKQLEEQEKRTKEYIKQKEQLESKLEKAKAKEEDKINKEIEKAEQIAKNPKASDQALAIYDPNAIMIIEEDLKKTDEVLEEKEEQIRKRWNLPKLNDSSVAEPGFISTSFGNKAKDFESSKARVGGHTIRPIFSGSPSGASVNHSPASISKDININTNNKSRASGGNVNTDVAEHIQPNASTTGNVNKLEKELGKIIGWNLPKSAGPIKSTSVSPKFSISNSSSDNTKLGKLDNNITKRSVEQKILSSSKSWSTDEKGYKTSGERYLPYKFYVKDNIIEYSIIGTSKRKNINSATENEIQQISKIL